MLIYKITNIINNKIYIGQTKNTLKERKREYYNEYKWDTRNRPIILAMRKYGIENFIWSIVEDNIFTSQELDEKERYYIKKFKSLCSQNGYNIELGGNSTGKHSEETKKKISESQLGEKNHMYGKRGSQNVTSKPIIDLTTDKIYKSAMLAAEDLKLNFSHICASARGTRGSTGGHVFRYLDENNEIIQPETYAHIKSLKTQERIFAQIQTSDLIL